MPFPATQVSETPSAPLLGRPAGRPTATLPAGYQRLSRVELQEMLRPINAERNRLRTKIIGMMAERSGLSEGARYDNVTRRIDLDDTELQEWSDLANAIEARIAELDALEAPLAAE